VESTQCSPQRARSAVGQKRRQTTSSKKRQEDGQNWGGSGAICSKTEMKRNSPALRALGNTEPQWSKPKNIEAGKIPKRGMNRVFKASFSSWSCRSIQHAWRQPAKKFHRKTKRETSHGTGIKQRKRQCLAAKNNAQRPPLGAGPKNCQALKKKCGQELGAAGGKNLQKKSTDAW